MGYRFGGSVDDSVDDSKRDIGETSNWGLIIGDGYDPQRQIEFLYSHQGTEVESGLSAGSEAFDLDIDYFHLGGTYFTRLDNRIEPFVSGGLGVTHMSPSLSGLDSETRFSLSVGGGMKWFPVERVGLRLEVRGYFTLMESDSAIFCSGGCRFHVSGNGFAQFETNAGVVFRF